MEDKMLMEGLLWDMKEMADLCMHGSIESGTESVHSLFQTALKDILNMQNEIYTLMSNEGWYCPSNVAESKISQVKQKFQTFVTTEE